MKFRQIMMASAVALVTNTAAAVDVTFSITPDNQNHDISPLIYGTNQDLVGGENFDLYRLGGNRLTGYNWENNASNAGSDYQQSSDNFLTYNYGISGADEDIPGIVLTTFHDNAVNAGARSIVTLQMAGYVAKDKNGTVQESETAPSAHAGCGQPTVNVVQPFAVVNWSPRGGGHLHRQRLDPGGVHVARRRRQDPGPGEGPAPDGHLGHRRHRGEDHQRRLQERRQLRDPRPPVGRARPERQSPSGHDKGFGSSDGATLGQTLTSRFHTTAPGCPSSGAP